MWAIHSESEAIYLRLPCCEAPGSHAPCLGPVPESQSRCLFWFCDLVQSFCLSPFFCAGCLLQHEVHPPSPPQKKTNKNTKHDKHNLAPDVPHPPSARPFHGTHRPEAKKKAEAKLAKLKAKQEKSLGRGVCRRDSAPAAGCFFCPLNEKQRQTLGLG